MHCALLSPLVWIIQSMNISLIIAGKAEWRRVQDAVTLLRLLASRGPIYSTLPRHIASHLQLSTYQPHHTHTHTYLHTLHPHFTSCYSCSSLFPHLCSLFLPHHPFHFCLPSFFLLVCVTVSFVSFSLIAPPSRTPLLPLFSSCSGWIETLCLLQGMLFSLIGQPTGRNLRQR